MSDAKPPAAKPWKRLTVMIVVEVPPSVTDRSDEELLEDVGRLMDDGWHADDKDAVHRYALGLEFATVYRGVSLAALEAGCEPPEPEEDLPLCMLCGKGQAWHFEHKPRHTFKPEE